MKKTVSSSWVVWVGSVGVVWGFFVCLKAYFFKPFNLTAPFLIVPTALPSLSASLDYFVALLNAFFLLVIAYGGGRKLFSLFKFKFSSTLEKIVFCSAIGYAGLAYDTFTLAALQVLYKPVVFIFLLLSFAGALYWIKTEDGISLGTSLKKEVKAIVSKSRVTQGLLIIGGGVLVLDGVMAFVPEIFYDALVYHLGLPQLYLLEHGFVNVKSIYASFPQLMEMIYALGLVLKDDKVTKLTHVIFLGLLGGGFLCFGQRIKNNTVGVLAAVLFCLIPTVQMNVWVSGVDVAASFYGFLAVYCFIFMPAQKKKTHPLLILSGMFAGLAGAVKYPAGLVLILLAAILIIRDRGKGVGVFLGMGTLIMAPWLIKNLIQTGNPVYPFFHQWLGHVPLDPARFERLVPPNMLPQSITELFRIPWDISMVRRSHMGFLGPIFLACFLFVVPALIKNKTPWFRSLVYFCGVYAVLGLLITRDTRFLLAGTPALVLLFSVGLHACFNQKDALLRWGVGALVLVCFYLQFSWAALKIHDAFKPRDVLLGNVSAFDFRMNEPTRMRPNPSDVMYRAMEEILPKESRVYLLGEEKVYPLSVPYVYSGPYSDGPLINICNHAQNAADAAQALKKLGVTHVMVNVREANRLGAYGIFNWTKHGFAIFEDLWKKHFVFRHVEYVNLKGGYTNTLILFELSTTPKTSKLIVPNVIAPIYKR